MIVLLWQRLGYLLLTPLSTVLINSFKEFLMLNNNKHILIYLIKHFEVWKKLNVLLMLIFVILTGSYHFKRIKFCIVSMWLEVNYLCDMKFYCLKGSNRSWVNYQNYMWNHCVSIYTGYNATQETLLAGFQVSVCAYILLKI